MTVEVGERRSARLDREVAVTSRGPSAAASSAHEPEGLDWRAFRAAYFPGRRRHDLEALTGYAVYKRGRAGTGSSEEAIRIEKGRRRIGATALRRWEDEGGATLSPESP